MALSLFYASVCLVIQDSFSSLASVRCCFAFLSSSSCSYYCNFNFSLNFSSTTSEAFSTSSFFFSMSFFSYSIWLFFSSRTSWIPVFDLMLFSNWAISFSFSAYSSWSLRVFSWREPIYLLRFSACSSSVLWWAFSLASASSCSCSNYFILDLACSDWVRSES